MIRVSAEAEKNSRNAVDEFKLRAESKLGMDYDF